MSHLTHNIPLFSKKIIHLVNDNNYERLLCERCASFIYAINKNKTFHQFNYILHLYIRLNEVSITLNNISITEVLTIFCCV